MWKQLPSKDFFLWRRHLWRRLVEILLILLWWLWAFFRSWFLWCFSVGFRFDTQWLSNFDLFFFLDHLLRLFWLNFLLVYFFLTLCWSVARCSHCYSYSISDRSKQGWSLAHFKGVEPSSRVEMTLLGLTDHTDCLISLFAKICSNFRFVATACSVHILDCHIWRLLSVKSLE